MCFVFFFAQFLITLSPVSWYFHSTIRRMDSICLWSISTVILFQCLADLSPHDEILIKEPSGKFGHLHQLRDWYPASVLQYLPDRQLCRRDLFIALLPVQFDHLIICFPSSSRKSSLCIRAWILCLTVVYCRSRLVSFSSTKIYTISTYRSSVYWIAFRISAANSALTDFPKVFVLTYRILIISTSFSRNKQSLYRVRVSEILVLSIWGMAIRLVIFSSSFAI